MTFHPVRSSAPKPGRSLSTVPTIGTSRAKKLRRLNAARGIARRVPAETVRAHIEHLVDMGFSYSAIAAAAGVGERTAYLIARRPQEHVLAAHAKRLMSVGHHPVPEQAGMLIPAIGVRRRIEALNALGWSQEGIGHQLGVSRSAAQEYRRSHSVYYGTWLAVTRLYDELSSIQGPSKKARTHAIRNGYAPPMAWESLDIDHPDARPDLGATDSGEVDEVLLARIIAGHHRGPVPKAERDAFYDHVITEGWHPARAAECLGIKQDAAGRAILRRKARLREEAA